MYICVYIYMLHRFYIFLTLERLQHSPWQSIQFEGLQRLEARKHRRQSSTLQFVEFEVRYQRPSSLGRRDA